MGPDGPSLDERRRIEAAQAPMEFHRLTRGWANASIKRERKAARRRLKLNRRSHAPLRLRH